MSGAVWRRALFSCVRPGDGGAGELERRWDPSGAAIVGLSVRSLFDLWLSAHGWTPGDRIIFTAFTIGDMPRLARAHGLSVIALDVDPRTGEPDADELLGLIDHRTRAVVYTHLFGARGRVEPLLRIAHASGVEFVEDCAEAYAGSTWRGHPDSDLALFSFGPIKTATAIGGALARVDDPDVRDEMSRLAALLPLQRRDAYGRRLVKYGLLDALAAPFVFGIVVRALDAIGPGSDAVLQRITRGFPGPDLVEQVRRRPSAPLVRTLADRLDEGEEPVRRRIAPGRRLMAALDGTTIPTEDAESHAYWLVPVLAPDPGALIDRLATRGFHATRGRAFEVVEHDDPDLPSPSGARYLYAHAVFLPFDPGMPDAVIDRLASSVTDELRRQRDAIRVPPGLAVDDACRGSV